MTDTSLVERLEDKAREHWARQTYDAAPLLDEAAQALRERDIAILAYETCIKRDREDEKLLRQRISELEAGLTGLVRATAKLDTADNFEKLDMARETAETLLSKEP